MAVSELERIRHWISTYPGPYPNENILDQFSIDFTDKIPSTVGIFPSGLVEISRAKDILGNVKVHNQYNFGLYYVFTKDPGDDAGSLLNADWIMDFQRWVQDQSILGKAPTFGDDPSSERIQAQNGVLYAADEEGTATYMVQLSVKFMKHYEVI